jgi:arylsulfatase A-like enzyme
MRSVRNETASCRPRFQEPLLHTLATFILITFTACLSIYQPKIAFCDDFRSVPNIVLLLVDDMGWQDTSVPFHSATTELNRRYHTPNMQRLADTGMKFTQAYACAVCSPSRVSLMTGMNTARHMVTNWTLRKNRQPDQKHPRVKAAAWNLNGMSPTPGVERTVHAVTLPMLLKRSGYRTIHCGKAHFGAQGTPGANPLNLGFDVNIAGHAAGGPGSYYGKYNFSAAWRNGDSIWDVPGLQRYHGQEINLTEALTREAIAAIGQAVDDKVPFYLYMSHYAIHAPWEKDDRFHQKYVDAGLNGLPATYASMIEGMDKSLGDLMQFLEQHGVADNTVVIFMSDNGQPKQVPRNRPLRGHKLTPYEGGVRVPLIVKWPGVVKSGSVCNDHYVIIEDIFPTLLEIGGVEHYEQIGGKIDGVSFVPLLRGAADYPKDRPIFWHFPNTYDQPPYSAVRQGDWKLIYHHVTRKLELFNLQEDLSEQEDLAHQESGKTKKLAKVLAEFLRDTKADMPTDVATNKSVEYPDQVPH